MEEKEKETMDFEALYNDAKDEIKALKDQIEAIVKRYQKLSLLYNDMIEKFLSAE